MALAILGRWALNPLLGAHLPFSTMYPAIAVAVWYGGWFPTTLVTVLGYLAIDWLYIPPIHSLRIADPLQLHELATFSAGGLIIIVFGELTRRARARAERRSEEFETLIETAPVGIAVATDSEGQKVWGNSTMRSMLDLAGRSRRGRPGVTGPGGLDCVFSDHGRELSAGETPIRRVCRENRPIQNQELEARPVGGPQLSVLCSATPLRDPQGRARGCIATFLDITERREAEQKLQAAKEQLAAANEMLEARVQERTLKLQEALADLEAFSYSVAHDMRGPLRSMTSFADLLRTGWEEKLDGEAKDYLQRISKSARRLDALIVDVLKYSQVVQERWPLQPVDLDSLTREIVRSYPGFQPPGAVVRIESELPRVMANVGGLTQCVSNLIENGIKFAKPQTVPEITIRAERAEGRVRIWFEDNGIGISPAWHKRIFDLFQQYHPIGKYEGTGIGLTIVRKSVERMGGRVGVESELGQGSRFWIELEAVEVCDKV